MWETGVDYAVAAMERSIPGYAPAKDTFDSGTIDVESLLPGWTKDNIDEKILDLKRYMESESKAATSSDERITIDLTTDENDTSSSTNEDAPQVVQAPLLLPHKPDAITNSKVLYAIAVADAEGEENVTGIGYYPKCRISTRKYVECRSFGDATRFHEFDYVRLQRLSRDDMAAMNMDAFAKIILAGQTYYLRSHEVVIGRAIGSQPHTTGKRKHTTTLDSPGPDRLDVWPQPDEDGNPTNSRSLSKEHLRFAWDYAESKWSLEVLGRNGIVIDDNFIPQGTKILLEDNVYINMGHVWLGWEQAQPEPVGDEPTDDDLTSDSNSEVSSLANAVESAGSENSPEHDMPMAMPVEQPEPAQIPTATTESQPAAPQVPKKNRPGRPSKDPRGSKREQRIIAKALKDGKEPPKLPIPPTRTVKKYSKKTDSKPDTKPKQRPRSTGSGNSEDDAMHVDDDEEEEADGEDNSADQDQNGNALEIPELIHWKKEECTPEQLAPPKEGPYDIQLWHILKEAGKPMGLQQIYPAMKNKWPYYYFKESPGWQSSVRHNIGDKKGFRSTGKAGKGKLYEINPEYHWDTKLDKAKKDTKTQKAQPTARPQGNLVHHPAYAGYPPHSSNAYYAQSTSQPPSMSTYGPGSYPRQPPYHAQGGASHPGAPNQVNTPYGTPNGSTTTTTLPMRQTAQRPPMSNNTNRPTNVASPSTTASQPRITAQAGYGQMSGASGSGAPSAGTPTTIKESDLRSLKRKVFENFRGSLVNLAPDQATKTKYHQLMNQAINYAVSHPDGEPYRGTGADASDIKKIVSMLWSSWDEASVNPNRKRGPGPSPQPPAAKSATTSTNAPKPSGTNPPNGTINKTPPAATTNTSATTKSTAGNTPTTEAAKTSSGTDAGQVKKEAAAAGENKAPEGKTEVAQVAEAKKEA